MATLEIKPTRCNGVSKQAQQFIENTLGADFEPIDLSPEGIDYLRKDNSEVSAKGCLETKEKLKIVTKDEVINGVSVQWVIPKETHGEEIILYFFGGGFILGCPEDDLSMTSQIADMTHRRVCVPRYSLAPEKPFPSACNDAMAVYRSLIKKQKVIVVGESAGGNLALGLVINAITKESLPPPKALALLSPWIDLSHSGESHKSVDDPTLSVDHFLKPASIAYSGKIAPENPQISPLFLDIPSNFPPTTISTGTRDILLSDCTRLAEKIKKKNIVVDLQITEGVWHVFEWYPELPEALVSLKHISEFLSKYMEN